MLAMNARPVQRTDHERAVSQDLSGDRRTGHRPHGIRSGLCLDLRPGQACWAFACQGERLRVVIVDPLLECIEQANQNMPNTPHGGACHRELGQAEALPFREGSSIW